MDGLTQSAKLTIENSPPPSCQGWDMFIWSATSREGAALPQSVPRAVATGSECKAPRCHLVATALGTDTDFDQLAEIDFSCEA